MSLACVEIRSGAAWSTIHFFIDGQFDCSAEPDTVESLSTPRPAAVSHAYPMRVWPTWTGPLGRRARPSKAHGTKCLARERGRMLMRLAEAIRERADELAESSRRATAASRIVEAESDIKDAATCFEYYARSRINGARRRHAGRGRRAGAGNPRAGRCRGSDHSVELPAPHGGVETGAGDLRRLHGRPEAVRGDAALDSRARYQLRRRRRAARRDQHRDWPGRGRPAAALVAHPDVDKVAFTGSVEVGPRRS